MGKNIHRKHQMNEAQPKGSKADFVPELDLVTFGRNRGMHGH